MMRMVQRVATAVLAEHGACRAITNLGAYQESKHLHWHLVSGEPLR
jgi:histidine triad (HIT) family protein